MSLICSSFAVPSNSTSSGNHCPCPLSHGTCTPSVPLSQSTEHIPRKEYKSSRLDSACPDGSLGFISLGTQVTLLFLLPGGQVAMSGGNLDRDDLGKGCSWLVVSCLGTPQSQGNRPASFLCGREETSSVSSAESCTNVSRGQGFPGH